MDEKIRQRKLDNCQRILNFLDSAKQFKSRKQIARIFDQDRLNKEQIASLESMVKRMMIKREIVRIGGTTNGKHWKSFEYVYKTFPTCAFMYP